MPTPVIFNVPQMYTFAEANAAASPGDVIYMTGSVSSQCILTKAVHVINIGFDPASTAWTGRYISSNANYGALQFNISDWGDVTELFIEGMRLHTSSITHTVAPVCIYREFPVGRKVFFNRCTLAASRYLLTWNKYYVDANVYFEAEFRHCWFVGYEYPQSSTSDYPKFTGSDYHNLAAAKVQVIKCVMGSTNMMAPESYATWEIYSDYVFNKTGAGTLYGPTGEDAAQIYDPENPVVYAIHGEITDIPEWADKNDFRIELYPEASPGSNTRSNTPLTWTGIDHTTNKWEFRYLQHNRRFGLIIQPPDGMQGHWLRWYNPEALIIEE